MLENYPKIQGAVIFTTIVIIIMSWIACWQAWSWYHDIDNSDDKTDINKAFTLAWLITIMAVFITVAFIIYLFSCFYDSTKDLREKILGGSSDGGSSGGGSLGKKINWKQANTDKVVMGEIQPGKSGITLYFGGGNIPIDIATEEIFPLGHQKTFPVPVSTRGKDPKSGDVVIRASPASPAEIVTLDNYGNKIESVIVKGYGGGSITSSQTPLQTPFGFPRRGIAPTFNKEQPGYKEQNKPTNNRGVSGPRGSKTNPNVISGHKPGASKKTGVYGDGFYWNDNNKYYYSPT